MTALSRMLAIALLACSFGLPPALRADDLGPVVDLFDAMRDGDIEVHVIPRDAERVTIQVKNNLDRPLRIRAPEGVVAAPVLAQFPAANPARNGATPAPPQALGVGFPNGGLNNGADPNLGAFNGGIMSIPSGRTVKVRLPAVCLEYGKHEPRPVNDYTLVPFEHFSHKQALRELLLEFGAGRYPQKSVQAAAWHLADGLSFKQLGSMMAEDEFKRKVYRFQPEEVAIAEELVKSLPAVKNAAKSGP